MKIMYCATPTRMMPRAAEVRARARQKGFAPVIPFDLGPYEDFEGNAGVGRERTLEMMLKVQRACDLCGVFGISRGVLAEVNDALKTGQTIRTFPGLDPEWDAMYEKLRDESGDPLSRLRGTNKLVVLAGGRAVGKTYWADDLLDEGTFGIHRVRTRTTRAPRGENDHQSYRFVSHDEFRATLASHSLLEHDLYRDNFYGSSLDDMKEVLARSHGIMALTPPGVAAVWDCRYEINVRILRVMPANRSLMERNLDRRGITDKGLRASLMTEAERYSLPPDIGHSVVSLTGGPDDRQTVSAAVMNLLQ